MRGRPLAYFFVFCFTLTLSGSPVFCCAVLCFAVFCCAVLCSVVLCCVLLCCAGTGTVACRVRERKMARLQMALEETEKAHQTDVAQLMESVTRLQKENKELFDQLSGLRSQGAAAGKAVANPSWERERKEMEEQISRLRLELEEKQADGMFGDGKGEAELRRNGGWGERDREREKWIECVCDDRGRGAACSGRALTGGFLSLFVSLRSASARSYQCRCLRRSTSS